MAYRKNAFGTRLFFLSIFLILSSPLSAQGKILAQVDGSPVTFEKFQTAFEKTKTQIASETPIDFSSEEGQKTELVAAHTILEELIENILLEKEAQKMGLAVSPKEVEAEIAAVKSGYPDEAAFEASLKLEDITLSELKENLREQLLKEKVIGELKKSLKISEREIKEYYKNHLYFLYLIPQKIEVSHILVFSEARGAKVLAEIKAGQSFDETCRKFSEDTLTKNSGGYLGFKKKEDFPKDIQELIFQLKAEEISGLLKTSEGWEIFRCLSHRPKTLVPFKEARASIEKILFEEKKEKSFSDWLKNIRIQAKIEINEGLLTQFLASKNEKKP